MRVLLLSDTHGVLDPRIADLASTCDIAVHAGDIGAVTVLETLGEACGRVIAVRGNNDVPGKWGGGDAALTALPLQEHVELHGGTLTVVHGDAFPARDRHARLRKAFPQSRAVLYGHSHRIAIDRDAVPWVLNAGAAGRQRTFGGPSCLLLRAGRTVWELEERRFEMPARSGRR